MLVLGMFVCSYVEGVRMLGCWDVGMLGCWDVVKLVCWYVGL